MQTRTFVSFKSLAFADKHKQAIDGDLFPGQLLSEHLVLELNRRGYIAESLEMDDFAWTFYARSNKYTFWLHVGESGDGGDRWLVVANSTLSFVSRLLRIYPKSVDPAL